MHRHGDFYPFVSGYLKNVSTGNLILNTSGNIGDFPEMFEKLIETHRDVIGSMSRYKKKK